MRFDLRWLISVPLVLGLLLGLVAAQDGDKPEKSGKSKAAGRGKEGKEKEVGAVTPEREAAVMTFVNQHHPELSELLVHLKHFRFKEYERAVRDLFRTSEHLAVLRDRDSERHDLELQAWKVQSRIHLLSVRLQMRQTDELREQLRTAVNDKLDVRKSILGLERRRASQRAGKLDEQIENLNLNRQQIVERELRQWNPSAKAASGKTKDKSAP